MPDKLQEAEEAVRHLLVQIAYLEIIEEQGLMHLARMRSRLIGREYDAIRTQIIELLGEECGPKFDAIVDEKVKDLKAMVLIQGTAKLLAMMENKGEQDGV